MSPRNANHSIFRPARTHKIGAGSDDDFVYKGFRVQRQGLTTPVTYWITCQGHTIARSIASPEEAKRTIDEDTSGSCP